MIQNFLNDLILYMWKFSFSDQDRCALTKTSKYFRDLAIEIGYLKHINITGIKNFVKFVKRFGDSENILEKLVINQIHNPVSWMAGVRWPKEIIFNNCCMDNEIFDTPAIFTEKLVIIDYKNNSPIYINWDNLPSLKVLDVTVHDINFTGIEKCTLLEAIRINLDNNQYFPEFLAQLPNLKIIATTCFASSALHFMSPSLKICLVPKKEKFTSVSKLVPKSHLDLNFIMNIRCLDSLF